MKALGDVGRLLLRRLTQLAPTQGRALHTNQATPTYGARSLEFDDIRARRGLEAHRHFTALAAQRRSPRAVGVEQPQFDGAFVCRHPQREGVRRRLGHQQRKAFDVRWRPSRE